MQLILLHHLQPPILPTLFPQIPLPTPLQHLTSQPTLQHTLRNQNQATIYSYTSSHKNHPKHQTPKKKKKQSLCLSVLTFLYISNPKCQPFIFPSLLCLQNSASLLLLISSSKSFSSFSQPGNMSTANTAPTVVGIIGNIITSSLAACSCPRYTEWDWDSVFSGAADSVCNILQVNKAEDSRKT